MSPFLRGSLLLLALVQIAASTVVMLTPLSTSGQIEEAKTQAEVVYNNEFLGFAGHFSVAAEHNKSRTNNIYTWYQPPRNLSAPVDAPVLIWLQGGPGGPGWFGAFGELGNWYIGGASYEMATPPVV